MIKATFQAPAPVKALGIVVPAGFLFWAVFPFFNGFHAHGMDLVMVCAQGSAFLVAYLVPSRHQKLVFAVGPASVVVAAAVIDWGNDGLPLIAGALMGSVTGFLYRFVMMRCLSEQTRLQAHEAVTPSQNH